MAKNKQFIYNPFSTTATIFILCGIIFVLIYLIKEVQKEQIYEQVASVCRQRPPCLDNVPRCMILEPREGWCPPGVTPAVSGSTPDRSTADSTLLRM